MYYDPRRNEYIVPSTDTLEGFSDDDDVSQLHHHTSEEEEEGHKLNKPETDFTMYDNKTHKTELNPKAGPIKMKHGLVINVAPNTPSPGTVSVNEHPGAGGVEHFTDGASASSASATKGASGAAGASGATGASQPSGPDGSLFAGSKNPTAPRQTTYQTVESCYDGSTYNSAIAPGNSAAKVTDYKQVCNSDVACKGFTVVQDYPQKDHHTVQYKNRIDDGGFPKSPDPNSKCTTYIASSPPLSSVSQLQHNITSVTNPGLPVQQGSTLDFTNLTEWSGPSTVETSASSVNQNWPGGNTQGKWSWDADTLPKDTNYYMVDGSARDQQVVGLPKECNGTKLNPERAAIIKDPSNPDNLYVYVDGRKMAVKQDNAPGGGKMCYTVASWVDPTARSICEQGGTDITKTYDSNQANACTKKCNVSSIPSTQVPSKCFEAIPTIQGSGPDRVGSNTAVNCKSDIRPSDRVRTVNQVSKEANLWSNRGRKNAMLYNAKTEIASSKYDTIQKSNSLLRKQVGNSQSNSMKLDKLNNSIYSQQRQVEVANDETRRRNENLFLLKLLLTYCLVIAIPMILKRIFGTKLKNSYVLLIVVFITIPFIYILGSNLYAIRNRSPMRWPLRNWPTGPLPADDDLYEEETKAPVCPPHPRDVAVAEEEAMAIQEEIDELQQKIKSCEAKEQNWKKQLNKDQTRLCSVNEKIPGKSCHSGGITL